jgi:hypothetical protein
VKPCEKRSTATGCGSRGALRVISAVPVREPYKKGLADLELGRHVTGIPHLFRDHITWSPRNGSCPKQRFETRCALDGVGFSPFFRVGAHEAADMLRDCCVTNQHRRNAPTVRFIVSERRRSHRSRCLNRLCLAVCTCFAHRPVHNIRSLFADIHNLIVAAY